MSQFWPVFRRMTQINFYNLFAKHKSSDHLFYSLEHTAMQKKKILQAALAIHYPSMPMPVPTTFIAKATIKFNTVMASTRITARVQHHWFPDCLIAHAQKQVQPPTFPETKTSRWTRSKHSVRAYSAQCIKHAQIFSQNTFLLLLLFCVQLQHCEDSDSFSACWVISVFRVTLQKRKKELLPWPWTQQS